MVIMYNKLLLNANGGIIDINQQYEQDNCAIIAIGLGGTGVDCLRNLKAKVYNKIKPDNPDSAVPEYRHIKFLAVDTDKTGLENSNSKTSDIRKINMDTEFFDISYGRDLASLLKDNARSYDGNPAYKEWLLHDRIKILSARSGAGGVRQLGRLLFMEKAREFRDTVQRLITQARTDLDAPKVYVHIFTGTGGGTGAGCFLDACYLVREASSGVPLHLCGYFFLPDVTASKEGMDKETKEAIKASGYAAMREFDYCMNFERNGDQWSQYYTNVGLIDSESSPVDICHLITAEDSAGNLVTDAYGYAINVVTDYLMDFVAKTTEDFSMESHIANYESKKSEVYKAYGARYEYCVIGASYATLPFKEILTYLAAKMFEGFSTISDRLPNQRQFDEFVKMNGLEYNRLFNDLARYKVNWGFHLPDISHKDAKNDKRGDDLVTSYFQRLRDQLEGRITDNFAAMTRSLENHEASVGATSGSPASVIVKIREALIEMMINHEQGPYFATAILRNVKGGDLLALIEGHLAEVRSKLGHEDFNVGKIEEEREKAQDDFFNNSNALNAKKKFNAYCSWTRRLVESYSKAFAYSKMIEFLGILKKQLKNLDNSFTAPFKDVTNKLVTTFAANKTYLDDISDTTTGYAFPIIKINDIKPLLDDYVADINIPEKTTEFMRMMLSEEGIKAWSSGNENEIVKIVTKYFTTLFSEHSQKTMTMYLKDKYETTDTARLINYIRNDIMQRLDNYATPMFSTSNIYSIDLASRVGYISLPETSSEVKQAALKLVENAANDALTVRPTGITDHIAMMRCLVGVPLYGYQELLRYERDYHDSPRIGRYSYQGKTYKNDDGATVTGRDWNILPSPTPYSAMNASNNKTLRERAQVAAQIYQQAEENDIIFHNEIDVTKYSIRTLSDDYLKRVKEIYENAADQSNEVKYHAQQEIKQLERQYNDTYYEILNDGAADLPDSKKRDIRIDHFVSAHKYIDIVKEQLEQIANINEMIANLEPKSDPDFENYLRALFSGVIALEGAAVKFTDDLTDEDVILSKPSMEKGSVPLYQGLLNYRKLDTDIKDTLKADVDSVLNAIVSAAPECVILACEKMEKELSKETIKSRLAVLSSQFPMEIKEVRGLYREIQEKFTAFKTTYLN